MADTAASHKMVPGRRREIDLNISPLLPSVPLSGSDSVLGLSEINSLLRIGPPCDSEDDPSSWLPQSHPSISSRTLSEIQEQLDKTCLWVSFAHYSIHTPLARVYSIPGSVMALQQRLNWNMWEYLVSAVRSSWSMWMHTIVSC